MGLSTVSLYLTLQKDFFCVNILMDQTLIYTIFYLKYCLINGRDANRMAITFERPSPGYAGVILSLAKTELNVCGLHTTDGLRLNFFFFFFLQRSEAHI
jgi:hypothetical protein